MKHAGMCRVHGSRFGFFDLNVLIIAGEVDQDVAEA
jgi:hypothetical protein